MEEQAVKKSWRELKSEREAETNAKLHRSFIIKPEFCTPYSRFQTMDGTRYYIAPDGSRRRMK
jgi:hypothetical protein